MKKSPFSNEEMTRALIIAEHLGKLQDYFIVVNRAHLVQLLETGAVKKEKDYFYKVTTDRPCWIFTVETGAETLNGSE